jgi:hypothetical protein
MRRPPPLASAIEVAAAVLSAAPTLRITLPPASSTWKGPETRVIPSGPFRMTAVSPGSIDWS